MLEGRTVLSFTFPAERIVEGWNEVTVYNTSHVDWERESTLAEQLPACARIRSLELAVAAG